MVKLFDTHSPEMVILNWDTTAGETREEKLSHLATHVSECFKLQKTFCLILPNKRLAPKWGRDHYEACLKELALYEGGHEQAS
jgi:uncharacterized protein (DUF58 family)